MDKNEFNFKISLRYNGRMYETTLTSQNFTEHYDKDSTQDAILDFELAKLLEEFKDLLKECNILKDKS